MANQYSLHFFYFRLFLIFSSPHYSKVLHIDNDLGNDKPNKSKIIALISVFILHFLQLPAKIPNILRHIFQEVLALSVAEAVIRYDIGKGSLVLYEIWKQLLIFQMAIPQFSVRGQ